MRDATIRLQEILDFQGKITTGQHKESVPARWFDVPSMSPALPPLSPLTVLHLMFTLNER